MGVDGPSCSVAPSGRPNDVGADDRGSARRPGARRRPGTGSRAGSRRELAAGQQGGHRGRTRAAGRTGGRPGWGWTGAARSGRDLETHGGRAQAAEELVANDHPGLNHARGQLQLPAQGEPAFPALAEARVHRPSLVHALHAPAVAVGGGDARGYTAPRGGRSPPRLARRRASASTASAIATRPPGRSSRA